MTILLAGVNETLKNRAVTGATPAAATETVVSGSQIVLPGALKVGAKFKWQLSMTKTAAGTGDTSFKVKTNTTTTVATGTTGGAATALTLAFTVAETAAIGSTIVDIEAVVQAVDASAGVMFGELYAASTATAATGFSNQQVGAVGGSLDTSSDILAVGLTITTGASDAVTINFVSAEYVSP